MKKPIYLDYNGTTPLDPEVIAAMGPFLDEEFGNPSSSHWYGINPRKVVALSRQTVASLLGCDPQEIFFTSGGTESNNQAILGIAYARRDRGNHIITSNVEHPAVLQVCQHLEKKGFSVTYLPVDQYGRVCAAQVQEAVKPETILITIMHANNEVGSIQPIAEVSSVARERDIAVHTDAAQSVGKISAKVDELGIDMLSVAGHKLYAPKGVGALYVRRGMELQKLMFGAGQENGLRPGTENVLEIVGLGKACEIAQRDLDVNASHLKKMRDLLHDGLRARIQHVRLNGHPDKRLPNTLNLSFKNVDSIRILEEIGLDVAVSAGAACHSDHIAVSHVLEAMAVPLEWAKGTLRFSVGKFTTEAEIVRTIDIVSDTVKRLSPI